MNKLETLGKISTLESKIKELTKERDALRVDAVSNGWAVWTVSIRQGAPSLKWWKENRLTVWQKYATSVTVKKFAAT